MSTASPQWQTSNPALSQGAVNRARSEADVYDASVSTMTVGGTAAKTLLLCGILLCTAVFTWTQTFTVINAGNAGGAAVAVSNPFPWIIGGAIGGMVLAFITIFSPRVSPYTSPLYAACEGLFLGGISALAESRFPGIAVQSIGLTVGTLVLMLTLYTTGIIKVTRGLAFAIVAATGAVALTYLVDVLLRVFLGMPLPFLRDNGWIGIGISLLIVTIAAFNLLLDFWQIQGMAESGAPKYMEWYGSFSLMVTLVWLYLEILRLLMKLQSRD